MDDDDHPLLVELDSLRKTAARFQASHEAHAAAIQLQRHTLDASHIHELTAALEQENARLAHELDALRAHPTVSHHPAVVQVQELSLALRRVSDKMALTEDTLLERTSELSHARSELARARHVADGAYELAAHMRAREEASKARERELEFRARASDEERKMVDLVVQEYADLVRNLEGRKSAHQAPSVSNGSASTTNLLDTLQDGKSSLHKMLTASSTESENLRATVAELNAKVSNLQMTLDAERKAASHDRTLLSQTKTELDKLNLEDQTAAKMVARYMKFSQASTNSLQQQITTLKTRHASTIATLQLQLSIAESLLASERARTARFQDALDELCEDLARESYGRRREVSLRLALLSREERVAEFMRRWARRARELYARCYNSAQPHPSQEDAVREAFYRVVSDAESLLSTLDDDLQFSDGTHMSGSLARIALSRTAVDALRSELQNEMQKRVEAVRKSAFSLPNGHLDGTASGIEDLVQSQDTPSQEGNGNARPEHYESPADSPVSIVVTPEETTHDPFVVSTYIVPPVAENTERMIVQEMSSPSIQDSASTSTTLLVEEESKAALAHSPAVSMLDLRQDLQHCCAEEPPTTDAPPIHALPTDTSVSDVQIPADHVEEPKTVQSHSPVVSREDLQSSGTQESPTIDVMQIRVVPSDSLISDVQVFVEHVEEYKAVQSHWPAVSMPDLEPSRTEELPTADSVEIHTLPRDTSISDAQCVAEDDALIPSTPIPVKSHVALDPPSTPTLLSQLGATKHRYDALQRAFRDCSLALKELKRTLVSSSPSSHTRTQLRQDLEIALARIDDYAEDARVELEIRVADEELTMRGFEMVLSVPSGLVDADERAEVETSARAFVDGTDEGVAKALDKFGKKLEDVQHDVAVVKRAVHGLAMSEGEDEEQDEAVDESKESGAGWTAWTAGLLGANSTPSRSPTRTQTFGTVMTSPRLRHTGSPKQLHEGAPERGPLAGLNLRIPMPLPSPSSRAHLGLGRAMEGEMRPRTLSAMYAMGGLRSSSIGLGVGLGGSPSPARTRGVIALGMGMGMGSASSLRASGRDTDDTRITRDIGEVNDLGGVE